MPALHPDFSGTVDIKVRPGEIKLPGDIDLPGDIELDRGHRARFRHRSQSDRPLTIDIFYHGITQSCPSVTELFHGVTELFLGVIIQFLK
ncbi:MAG: hypothetical protein GDA56_29500 [Hormoscilla sp. GM7CHS1pb]|nr:hypothetical protein [Hormoscilla sp. GM7CHS1pb]